MWGWFKKRPDNANNPDPRTRDPELAQLEERLVKVIPGCVRAIGINEPVYCLRIWYYGTDTVGDRTPSLTLPKESARQQLKKEKGLKLPQYLWGADELLDDWRFDARIKDASAMYLCRQWFDHSRNDDADETEELQPLREMVQRVAQRLNQFPWADSIPVTSDFVVFAADASHTFNDDYGEMVASVPPKRIEQLRKSGWLAHDPWWSFDPQDAQPMN
jgi:hypothetical protein